MMTRSFEVTILSREEVHTLPDAWPAEALRRLLELAEFDDVQEIADPDLLDMAIMMLQDLGNQEAGELVLEVLFGDSMRPGVRQNLVADLQEDEPWGDFANVAQQKGLFIAVVLLHQAFPHRYGTPDALKLQFSVQSLGEAGGVMLNTAGPAFLVRLLGAGMDGMDVLHRLYENELAGGPFTDAADLIWHLEHVTDKGEGAAVAQIRTFKLTSSRLWFGTLNKGDMFRASVPSG